MNKPYKPFFLAIPLILVLSLLGFQKTIDLQMHDTYFVIASIDIGIFVSIILGMIGFIYWLVRHQRLINWMTLVHVVITISTFVIIVIVGSIFYTFIRENAASFRTLNQVVFLMILLAAFSQLLFLTNLAISIRAKIS